MKTMAIVIELIAWADRNERYVTNFQSLHVTFLAKESPKRSALRERRGREKERERERERSCALPKEASLSLSLSLLRWHSAHFRPKKVSL